MILRFIGYLFGIGAVLFLAAAGAVAWYVSGMTQDLPNYDVLAKYEPPVMSRVQASMSKSTLSKSMSPAERVGRTSMAVCPA